MKQQLRDFTLIVAEVAYDDNEQPYAVTRIIRGDLEGDVEDFIRHVRNAVQVVDSHNPYEGRK